MWALLYPSNSIRKVERGSKRNQTHVHTHAHTSTYTGIHECIQYQRDFIFHLFSTVCVVLFVLAHHRPELYPRVSEHLRGLCMASLFITRDLSLGSPRDMFLNSVVIEHWHYTGFHPSIHPQEDLTEKHFAINLKGGSFTVTHCHLTQRNRMSSQWERGVALAPPRR